MRFPAFSKGWFWPILALLALVISVLIFGVETAAHKPAKNPDPNHIHMDFAIWEHGSKLDFTAQKYMTTEAQETALPENSPRKFLHLHDGNGHVLHSHKPGQTFGTFLAAIGYQPQGSMQLYVNGSAVADSADQYVLHDLDKILYTDATDPAEVNRELSQMTDDACLYSKTCPWRGAAPTEGCIADPTVPCKPD